MLGPGKSLSHFRLVEKIGQGGMGEVWRAVDSRLDREVAVKVLPAQWTRDPGRLDRFAREAKLLASLNDPGIATIHDIDEDESVRFLVMELVPGEDLSQVLERGPLPVPEALQVALHIARAVEAAHGQGVVHRDLKPANVKRTADGQVKVLDFGLAKALGPEVASDEASVSVSPTVTSSGTLAGMILGTAAYMSPEQARGRPVDKRTDIWSFGVLLYEMLTGDNPFRGDTVADSVGAILHRDPDLDALPPATPPAIRRLLRRCLARKRRHRLHDIADVRIELEEAIADPHADLPAPPAAPGWRGSKLPWIALAALVPLVAAGGWWVGSTRGPQTPERPRQFKLVPEVEVKSPVVSPDGTRVAYFVDNELYIRSLDALEPRKTGVEVEEGFEIDWSPDGQSLVVVDGPSRILRFDLDGGAPVTLTDSVVFMGHVRWADDGFVYFTQFQAGISRVPETGGAPAVFLERPAGMIDYHGMAVLPGGRGILTVPHLQQDDPRAIHLERPGHEPVEVYRSDSAIDRPDYSPTGHILFYRDDAPRGLWALPFSADTGRSTGDPFFVMADLTKASYSDAGDMVYSQSALQSGKTKRNLVWLDRTGEEVERLDMALYEAFLPVMSPDGSRVALLASGIGRPSTDKTGLWIVDLERGASTRLTTERIASLRAIWSADGTRIAYVEAQTDPDGEKVVSVRTDGTGDRQVLFTADLEFFLDLSPDWSIAAFTHGSLSGPAGMTIGTVRPGDPGSFATLVDGPGHDVQPAIHPGGNWIAFLTGNIPSFDLVVRPFPQGEGQWRVSAGSALSPAWSADGSRIYYIEGDLGTKKATLFEVPFDGSGAVPLIGRPRRLFEIEDVNAREPFLAPDGRFMRIEDVPPAEGEKAPDVRGMVLVENWLRRFAPAAKAGK